MNLTLEKCLKLEKAGYPQKGSRWWIKSSLSLEEVGWENVPEVDRWSYHPVGNILQCGYDESCEVIEKVVDPTLEELIKACALGDVYFDLRRIGGVWSASCGKSGTGEEYHADEFESPEEAVCNLYLELHKL